MYKQKKHNMRKFAVKQTNTNRNVSIKKRIIKNQSRVTGFL